MLLDLRPKNCAQGSLFGAPPPATNAKRERLMAVLDKANGKWGRDTLGVGSAGLHNTRAWDMHRSNLSPCYTTRWSELRVVCD